MAQDLASLVQILDQYQYEDHFIHIRPQLQSLTERASFLRDSFAQKYLKAKKDEMEKAETKVRDAAREAEDSIDLYVRNRVLEDQSKRSQFDLTGVLEKFHSIEQDLVNIVSVSDMVPEVLKIVSFDKMIPPPADDEDVSCITHGLSSRMVDSSSQNIEVGLEGEFLLLRDSLLEEYSKRKIIAIVGVGGIGKTTLSRKLYNDSSVSSNFSTCAWVTISLEYNAKTTLLAILEGLGKLTSEMHHHDHDKLGEIVERALKGSKYFIVFDDVWDIDAWKNICRFLPDDKVGSALILTTREHKLAEYAATGKPHEKCFMSLNESWSLFSQMVFRQERIPIETEIIGRRTTKLCGGLPLSITLMAGLLATSQKSREHWELLTVDVVSELTAFCSQVGLENKDDVRTDAHVVILPMIYNLLPYYLKPCFLLIGAFLEDVELKASTIIQMWIAEGFVNPVAGTSMEDTAEGYLKALIDMNLLLVCQVKPDGRIKSFKIHDILRDFCHEKALREKFLWFKDLRGRYIPRDRNIMRRVSSHQLSRPVDEEDVIPARSLFCIGRSPLDGVAFYLGSRLLRVVDVFQVEFYQFPTEILQLVLLRFLAFSCHSDLPNSISKLQNLQSLIIRRLPSFRAFTLPSELWELSHLRHVKSKETCVWYYPENASHVVLGKLQTLSNVQMVGVTEKFLGNIPNIRKLGLFCNIPMSTTTDLACLQKLETLKCTSDWSLGTRDFLSFLSLPRSLKKLTLSLCKIPQGFMATVGQLPILEQLRLQKSDFLSSSLDEPEWELAEGDFPSLISLRMEELDLVHLKANSANFPSLQHLIIRGCYAIETILVDIGSIPTIKLFEVDKFSPSVEDFAVQVQKEQEARGNKLLQVRII